MMALSGRRRRFIRKLHWLRATRRRRHRPRCDENGTLTCSLCSCVALFPRTFFMKVYKGHVVSRPIRAYGFIHCFGILGRQFVPAALTIYCWSSLRHCYQDDSWCPWTRVRTIPDTIIEDPDRRHYASRFLSGCLLVSGIYEAFYFSHFIASNGHSIFLRWIDQVDEPDVVRWQVAHELMPKVHWTCDNEQSIRCEIQFFLALFLSTKRDSIPAWYLSRNVLPEASSPLYLHKNVLWTRNSVIAAIAARSGSVNALHEREHRRIEISRLVLQSGF